LPPLRSNLAKEVPIVRILEVAEYPLELIPQILREINDRQWGCVLQLLVEAKIKAESMLRNDSVFDSPGKVAFYSGWIAYSDYVLSSLETLRSQQAEIGGGPRPGPET